MDERITSTLKSGINHFDSARVTRMREVMKRHVDSGAVPGLVMLVHHRGRELADTIGTMGYSAKEPIQRNTIFRLASMTKPITAVGAMLLIEECKVRLDDPVDEWLPESVRPDGTSRFDLMVARGGIEPPTRGFSVQSPKGAMSLK